MLSVNIQLFFFPVLIMFRQREENKRIQHLFLFRTDSSFVWCVCFAQDVQFSHKERGREEKRKERGVGERGRERSEGACKL